MLINYCENDIYQIALNLLELENNYSSVGFLRISKSMVVNLYKIKRLKSYTSGRIEVIMKNDGNRIVYVKILTLVECFFISLAIALVEYCLFNNYDELSKEKKTSNTIVWAILTNIIVIASSIIFNLFPPLPIWGYALLVIVLEISLIAMRYSIYVVNLSDTEELNN